MHLTDIPASQLPPGTGARRYLAETEDVGEWELFALPDGTPAIRFFDDGDVVPLHDLAYNRTLGIFDRKQFPNEPDE